MRFFIFVLLCKYLSYLSSKKSETFPTDSCVNGLSDLIFQNSESCSPPLSRAAGKNTRKTVFCIQKLISQKTK
jgi:hypothetical protein